MMSSKPTSSRRFRTSIDIVSRGAGLLRISVIHGLVWYAAFWALSCASPYNELQTPTSSLQTPGQSEAVGTAQVADVITGEIIDVEIEGQRRRVRYLGISVPAENAPGAEGRVTATEARDFNRFLVEGRTVELEPDTTDTDLEGNLLRYVYVDGEMVNKALLTNGYATVSDFRRRAEFLDAEENARASRRGLWEPPPAAADIEGTPPPEPTPILVLPFYGGTLPLPRTPVSESETCEYSGTTEPVIKGNRDPRTGNLDYYVPGNLLYSTTVVDQGQGDRWFCTEAEAAAAGWKKSLH